MSMANVKLDDSRKYQAMTVEDADALFQHLALLETRIAAKTAAADKKIAEIKKRLKEETDSDSEALASVKAELTRYIGAHPERFAKPRMRKTAFGQYGLRTSTKLEITDADAVIDYSDDAGLDLYETSRTVIAKAVSAAMADGHIIPGVQQLSGSVASYKVDRIKDTEGK